MFNYSKQPQSIAKVLDNGIRLFMSSFKAVVVLAFIGALISNLPNLFSPSQPVQAEMPVAEMGAVMGLSILAMIAGLVFYNGIVFRINMVATNQAVTIGEALKKGLIKLLPVFIGMILYIIAVMLGMVLLVIPGLILMISLMFYSALIIVDDEGMISSLKKSHNLVWGNWWRTATVFLVPAVFFMVIYAGFAFAFGLTGWAGGLQGMDGDIATNMQSYMIYIVAFSTVTSAIGVPLFYSILLVQLHDLKLRKQGLDLEQRISGS